MSISRFFYGNVYLTDTCSDQAHSACGRIVGRDTLGLPRPRAARLSGVRGPSLLASVNHSSDKAVVGMQFQCPGCTWAAGGHLVPARHTVRLLPPPYFVTLLRKLGGAWERGYLPLVEGSELVSSPDPTLSRGTLTILAQNPQAAPGSHWLAVVCI